MLGFLAHPMEQQAPPPARTLALRRLIEHPWFDRLVIALIVLNSAAYAAVGPDTPPPTWMERLFLWSQLTFTVEIALRISVYSWSEYVADGWNIFDVLIVSLLWFPYLLPGVENLVAIRCIRALRLLRTIHRMPTVKTLVECMAMAMSGLMNVLALCAFIFTIFAILGMQLFGGTLRGRCGGTEGALCWPEGPANACGAGEGECVDVGRNPANGALSFDSFASALLTVFQCVTMEGWVDVMRMETAVFGPWAAIYFVALIVLGSFFVLNLFLVVIHEHFRLKSLERIRSDDEGNGEGSRPGEAVAFLDQRRRLLRQSTSRLVVSQGFRNFILTMIILNTLVLCGYYYGMPPRLEAALEWANVAFVIVFTAELVINISGMGMRGFFADGLNVADLAIVAVSHAELVAQFFRVGIGVNTSVLRALRLLRVARLARSHRGLRRVVLMIYFSVRELSSLCILLALLIAVFALVGLQLFGARFTPGNGFPVVPRTNFDDFGAALTTMFIVFSGEDWTDVFVDCFAFAPLTATAFFVTSVVAGSFVMMNLIVTILIANVKRVSEAELKDRVRLGEEPFTPMAATPNSLASTVVGGDANVDDDGDNDEMGKLRPSWWARPWSKGTLLGPPRRQPWWVALRMRARALVRDRRFDATMLLVIVLSAIKLAVEPLTPAGVAALSPWQMAALHGADVAITAAFTLELGIKVFAFGIRRYLSSPWNRLDAFIVTTSIASLAGGSGGAFFNAVRLARLLRPLRLISVHSGMRLVVVSLLRTLPAVFNVCLVCLLFIVIFAILGVQLFGGRFRSCSDVSVVVQATCTPPRVWTNPHTGNFDSVPAAMLVLFEMSTLESWPVHMFLGMDVVAPGYSPERDHSRFMALYFVSWILLGGFLLRNLFIGVIVDTFHTIKQQQDGLLFMTPEQKEWVKVQALMIRANAIQRAARPMTQPGQALYDIVTGNVFERFIMVAIVANMACMAGDAYASPAFVREAIAWSNCAFVAIFTVEAACKIVAFTPRKYFSDPWNAFDFCVVAGSLADLAMAAGNVDLFSPSLLRALRLFRVARMLRALRMGEGVRALLATLVQSLPSLFNVSVLLALLLFLYAVLGTHFFWAITDGDELGVRSNFASLSTAMLLLFGSATGEMWNTIMHDLSRGGGCEGQGADALQGCATWAAVPYFVAFSVLSNFVLLNIIVAIILDNFSNQATDDAVDSSRITSAHLDSFRDAWAEEDPDAKQRVHVTSLPNLVLRTPFPLGLMGRKSATPKAELMRFVNELDVAAYRLPGAERLAALHHAGGAGTAPAVVSAHAGADWVTYHDVLEAMIKRAFGAVEADQVEAFSPLAKEVRAAYRQRRRTTLHVVFAQSWDADEAGEAEERERSANSLLRHAARVAVGARTGRTRRLSRISDEVRTHLHREHIAKVFSVIHVQRCFRARRERRLLSGPTLEKMDVPAASRHTGDEGPPRPAAGDRARGAECLSVPSTPPSVPTAVEAAGRPPRLARSQGTANLLGGSEDVPRSPSTPGRLQDQRAPLYLQAYPPPGKRNLQAFPFSRSCPGFSLPGATSWVPGVSDPHRNPGHSAGAAPSCLPVPHSPEEGGMRSRGPGAGAPPVPGVALEEASQVVRKDPSQPLPAFVGALPPRLERKMPEEHKPSRPGITINAKLGARSAATPML